MGHGGHSRYGQTVEEGKQLHLEKSMKPKEKRRQRRRGLEPSIYLYGSARARARCRVERKEPRRDEEKGLKEI